METAWTVQTLKEHYDQRFRDQEKYLAIVTAAAKEAVNAALVTSKEAVDKAETNADRWRANANEWRAAMTDREARFASRIEMEQANEAIKQRVAGLEKTRDVGSGKVWAFGWVWGAILGLAGLVLSILAFWRH